MILQLLTGIHNLTTLLFGIFISAFFLGVKPSMKNFGKLLLFALVDVFLLGHQPLYRHGVCQSALPCFGTSSTHFIFVFVLPLFTFILLYFCFFRLSVLSVQQLDGHRRLCRNRFADRVLSGAHRDHARRLCRPAALGRRHWTPPGD